MEESIQKRDLEKLKSSMQLNKTLRRARKSPSARVSAENTKVEGSEQAKDCLDSGALGEQKAKRQKRLLNAIKILNHLSDNKPLKEQIILLFDSTLSSPCIQKYSDILLLLASIMLFAKFEGDYTLLNRVRVNLSYHKTHLDMEQLWSAEVDLIDIFSQCVNEGYSFNSVYSLIEAQCPCLKF